MSLYIKSLLPSAEETDRMDRELSRKRPRLDDDATNAFRTLVNAAVVPQEGLCCIVEHMML